LHPHPPEVTLMGKMIPIRQYMLSAVGKPSNPSPCATSIEIRPSIAVGRRSRMGKLAAAKTQSWGHPRKNNRPSANRIHTIHRFAVAAVVRIHSESAGSSPRMV